MSILANSSIESPTGQAIDKPSFLWPPESAPWVNGSRPTSLENALKSMSLERRDISDISYAFRPTPIEKDQQHQISLSTSLPFTNKKPTLLTNGNTNTHRGVAPIEEAKMPYDPFGNFIMNPKAPVFVPHQGSLPGKLPLFLEGSMGTQSDRGGNSEGS